jgi:hypothetical protein
MRAASRPEGMMATAPESAISSIFRATGLDFGSSGL